MQVRDMVNEFYAARYTAALERLHKLAPVLRLDMHLATHVAALTAVRSCHALLAAQDSSVLVLVCGATRRCCTSWQQCCAWTCTLLFM